jgi:hypothetical protein
MKRNWKSIVIYVAYVCLLAFFFANVEIQIEGGDGWAASLPTWRVENHWLLDIFWGGRAMTGYHAWVFSFMFLIMHLPFFAGMKWDWRMELQILAGIKIFWIMEDFIWFVLNPVYGLEKFSPKHIPWHVEWIWFMPTDYLTFLTTAVIMIWVSLKFKNDVNEPGKVAV